MSRLFYGHCLADGLKLRYYRTSDEKMTLMMLHGITDYGLCWGRVAMNFNQQYDLLLPDARGHGLSEASDSGYRVDDLADDAALMIQELGVAPVAVLGHSMGAATAVSLAARYPNLVRTLILEDPPYGLEELDPQRHAERLEGFSAWVASFKNQTLSELIQSCRQENPHWDEEEVQPWARSKQMFNPKALAAFDFSTHDWRAQARQLQCPVLLICGDNQRGAIVTPQISDEFLQLCRPARVMNIPEAGHSIHRDQYRPFVQAVRSQLFKRF